MPAEGTGHQASASPRDLSGPRLDPEGRSGNAQVDSGAFRLPRGHGRCRRSTVARHRPRFRHREAGFTGARRFAPGGWCLQYDQRRVRILCSRGTRDRPAVTLAVSHPGYQVARLTLTTLPEQPLAIELDPVISIADGIEVTANRAREGTDPITVTNISQKQIESHYWAQDPAILLSSLAPSFFSYNDSGNGIGYSYYWIRGFNQAQTRMTLNGAPLNDAESGELFFIDLADFRHAETSGPARVVRLGIGGWWHATASMEVLRWTGSAVRHEEAGRAVRLGPDQRHLGAHRALLENQDRWLP
jgi:hypothetical protein